MPTRISAETAARVAAVWETLLERIAAGECYTTFLPEYGLNYEAMRGYRDQSPERRVEWQNARKDSADYFIEQIVDMIHTPDIDPHYARVRLDACIKLTEKLNPDQYAPRTRADVNVRSVDLTAIINAAQARVAGYAARSLPGTCERVIDDEVLRAALPALSELL